MSTELKVSKGPLGEYLHLNIPETIDEPNKVMGEDCKQLDWII